MPISPRDGMVAAAAFLIAIAGFLAFTIYTPPGLMVDGSGTPIITVSAQLVNPPNPGGPTVRVVIYAASQGEPIIHISAVLVLTGRNQTYEFPDVTQDDPLLPGSSVSETLTIIGPVSLNSDIMYPILVSGTLMDGGKFNFVEHVYV